MQRSFVDVPALPPCCEVYNAGRTKAEGFALAEKMREGMKSHGDIPALEMSRFIKSTGREGRTWLGTSLSGDSDSCLTGDGNPL